MECVRILLEAAPQLDCYKNAAETACTRGNLALVQLLVEHQPRIIELASSGVHPCLLHAAIASARRGKEDVLSFLLEKGVNPNSYPLGSACPLAGTFLQIDAVPCNRLELIQKLLKAGADVNKLVENPSRQSLSFIALTMYMFGKPEEEVLELLIDAGLNLGVRDEDTGNTLLHFRAEKLVDTRRTLADEAFLCNMIQEWEKKHPCDHNNNSDSRLDAPNFKGETPLMLAVFRDNVPLVEALLKCGVDLNRSAFGQPSILHWLISEEYENLRFRKQMVKLLLQHGAPIDKIPECRRTLLHSACNRRGRTEVVKVLLKKGHMDPNCTIPDPEGGDPITPLMLAISQNDVETVELLIKRGAIVGESEKKAFPHDGDLSKLRGLLGVWTS